MSIAARQADSIASARSSTDRSLHEGAGCSRGQGAVLTMSFYLHRSALGNKHEPRVAASVPEPLGTEITLKISIWRAERPARILPSHFALWTAGAAEEEAWTRYSKIGANSATKLGMGLRDVTRAIIAQVEQTSGYQDSDSFSKTSFLARTREQSSQRFLSGSMVSL